MKLTTNGQIKENKWAINLGKMNFRFLNKVIMSSIRTVRICLILFEKAYIYDDVDFSPTALKSRKGLRFCVFSFQPIDAHSCYLGWLKLNFLDEDFLCWLAEDPHA